MGYEWNWAILRSQVPSGEATYFDWLLTGLEWTVFLSVSAWIVALVLGSCLGILRTTAHRWLSWIARVYVEIFRNIPLLVQLFLWYFVLPEMLPVSMGNAFKQMDPLVQQFIAAWLCLGLFTGARVTEQVRAGIESVSKGQKSAALALGLTLPQTYRFVLVPLSFRVILPPLTSEFLNTFKNSSVATTIGLVELSRQAQQLVDYTAQPYEAFISVTLLYIGINVTVMVLMRGVENRARIPGFVRERG